MNGVPNEDHARTTNLATGETKVEVLKATPEEQEARHIADLRRALESCDYWLAHVADPCAHGWAISRRPASKSSGGAP